MPGTLGKRRKQKGTGHGARNHKHASGNKLVLWWLSQFHAGWRPEKVKAKELPREWIRLKHERNRRKQ